MKRKVVFMTGAGGGMGSESFRQMLPDLGDLYDLVILVRDSQKNHELFDRYEKTQGLKVVYGDLINQEDVEKCVSMSDLVLHIAAFVSPAADYYPKKAMENNYGSVVNIINAIKKLGKQDNYKFVYIGTVAETGDRMPPIHWGRVGDPIKPSMFDYYAVSKVAAERFVIESGLAYWVSLRQTGIIGPAMAKIRDAIQFHNCLFNVLEYASDRDSGRAVTAAKLITKLPGGQKLMGNIIKSSSRKDLVSEHGTKRWIDENMEDHIEAYWGSKKAYDKIPDKISQMEAFTDWDKVVHIDHGYDESKPESELTLEDMKGAAEFRGGTCDSKEMTKGDWKTPLEFTCQFGHHFKGSPRLILEGGHWCDECERKSWNYGMRAKKDKFFAQVWKPLHDDSEIREYPKMVNEFMGN